MIMSVTTKATTVSAAFFLIEAIKLLHSAYDSSTLIKPCTPLSPLCVAGWVPSLQECESPYPVPWLGCTTIICVWSQP